MKLAAPIGYLPSAAIRDLSTGHPWLQVRWMKLSAVAMMRGIPLRALEIYRYHLRQQWLFGGGRTGLECVRANVPLQYARPSEPIVTNAASAEDSAHGYTLQIGGLWVPAAVGMDADPVGDDGKPYTQDDQWDRFITIIEPDANALGLRHFRDRTGKISDRPHLQLVEWDDHTRTLGPAGPYPT